MAGFGRPTRWGRSTPAWTKALDLLDLHGHARIDHLGPPRTPNPRGALGVGLGRRGSSLLAFESPLDLLLIGVARVGHALSHA